VALTVLSIGTGATMASAATAASPVPVSNPDLQAQCGLDIGLILDGSGSIGGSASSVRDAAKALLLPLADTNTNAGIVTYSTAMKASATVSMQPLTAASYTGNFLPQINSYASGGNTNWDIGLRTAKSSFIDSAANRASVPDLIVHITDGAPNTIGGAVGATSGVTPNNAAPDASTAAVDPAITAANALKAAGAHILTIGVGDAFGTGSNGPIFRAALAKVSGGGGAFGGGSASAIFNAYDPDGTLTAAEKGTSKYTTGALDISTTDVLFVKSFADLSSQLATIASKLCGGSLTIKKLASTPGAPDTYTPATGWDFKATPSAANASYEWILPTASAGDTNQTATTTGAQAAAGFQWKISNVSDWNNNKSVAIAETVKPNFVFDSVSCSKGSGADAASVTVTGLDTSTGKFNVAVGAQDIVTCTVKNKAQKRIDLSVTKAIEGSAPYALGTNRVFDVSVTNAGPSDATGVVVKDALPAGLSYVSYTADQGTYASATGLWTVGTIAAGATKTLKITATLASLGSVTNLAEVTVANETDVDSTPNNCANGTNKEDDCATVTIDVTRVYTLGIAKSAVTPGPLTLGDTATFDIVVTNNGPSPSATGFVVTDQLDASLTGASVVAGSTNANFTCSINGSNLLSCTYAGSLASGANAKIRVTGTVGAGLALKDAIANEACVIKTANDTGSKVCNSTSIPLFPDLVMEKSAVAPSSVQTGANASWKFRVTNGGGPKVTAPFTVTDTLPAGLTNVSITSLGAGWVCPTVTNSSITCTFTPSGAGLASGDSTTYIQLTGKTTVVPDVGSTSTLTNKACVVDSYNEPDNTPNNKNDGNDCAQADVTVTPKADLEMVKGATPNTVAAGGSIDYSLSVKNNGPSKTSVIQFTDTLPAGLIPGAVTADANWNCNVVNQTLTCTWVGGLINSGSSTTTVHWAATVGASLANSSSVNNEACVRAENTDVDSSNNCDDTTTTITPKIDLGLVKVADPSTIQVNGGNAKWNITVTNYGPSKASGFPVTDSLPANLTNVSVSGTSWSCPASPVASTGGSGVNITCTYTGPALNVGASAPVLVVSGTPNSSYNDGGTATNEACTSDDIVGDSRPADAVLAKGANYDCDSADVTITPVIDLEMVKNASPSSVKPGETITYTFAVKNNGPSSTSLISFTDSIPAGLVPVNGTLTNNADWACDITGNDVSCTWLGGPVAAGASTSNASIQVVVSDSLADDSSVSNTACTEDAFNEPDNTPNNVNDGNDCDTTTTNITPTYTVVVQKKQVEANPVAPGSVVHYQLTVTNNGPSTAPAGFSVTDPVPGLLDVTDASGTGFDCSATVGNAVSCEATSSLAKGASRVVTVTATVTEDAANADGVVNTACIDTDLPVLDKARVGSLVSQGGPVGQTGTCSSVTTEFPSGSLTLGKSNVPTEAVALEGFGSQITYTLTATANGTLNQKNVVVTDIIPGFDPDHASATSEFVSAVCKDAAAVVISCGATPYNAGTHTVTAELGTIAAGTSKTVTIVVTIPVQASPSDPAPNSIDIFNQGHATTAYTGTGPDGDVDSNIVKNVLNVVTAAGEPSNVCTEDIPVFGVTGSGFFAGETVKLDVYDKDGNLIQANYQPSNLGAPVTATANASGDVSFSGVWWPGFSVDPDTSAKTYPGPSAAQIKVVLHGSPSTNQVTINYPEAKGGCVAGLEIAKSNDPGTDVTITEFGTEIKYTINVTATAGNVYNIEDAVVTDVLPGYGTLTSGTVTYQADSADCDATIPELGAASTCAPVYDAGTHTLTWGLGAMRPGDTRQVTFVVTVDEQTLGASGDVAADFDVQNVASAESAYTDPIDSNVVINPVLVGVTPTDDGGPTDTPDGTKVLGTKLVKTGADLLIPAALLGMILVGLGFGARRLGRDPR